MKNKKLLVFVLIVGLVTIILVANNEEAVAKKKGSFIECEYANPMPGCQWTGGQPYPKCGAILVCDKPALQL